MVSISNILFGLVFVGVGLGVGWIGVQTSYLQVQDINSAVESTEGTINSVEVISDTEVEEGETEVEYYPRVSYNYTVDGEQFTGERIFSSVDRTQERGELVGKEYDSERTAQRVANQFSPGSTVTVYYFPNNPSRSFLVKPTIDWLQMIGMAVFGLIFALAGVGVLFSDD